MKIRPRSINYRQQAIEYTSEPRFQNHLIIDGWFISNEHENLKNEENESAVSAFRMANDFDLKSSIHDDIEVIDSFDSYQHLEDEYDSKSSTQHSDIIQSTVPHLRSRKRHRTLPQCNQRRLNSCVFNMVRMHHTKAVTFLS